MKRVMAKKQVRTDILCRLRRHFDQETCNEEPQMVIDQYEEDRRHAALEIAALRRRLAEVYARPPEPEYDEKVVPLRWRLS
jgi:hypothetical protein